MALSTRADLTLLRADIAEPARYYDRHRCIVMRSGLLVEEERRYLWHELVHADRRDRGCDGSPKLEDSVERQAARWAMPLSSLEWAMMRGPSIHEVAEALKLPEPWVVFRLGRLHPAERSVLCGIRERFEDGVA